MLSSAYQALDKNATVLFADNLCRRKGKTCNVFIDLLGTANRSCCNAHAKERPPHALTHRLSGAPHPFYLLIMTLAPVHTQ